MKTLTIKALGHQVNLTVLGNDIPTLMREQFFGLSFHGMLKTAVKAILLSDAITVPAYIKAINKELAVSYIAEWEINPANNTAQIDFSKYSLSGSKSHILTLDMVIPPAIVTKTEMIDNVWTVDVGVGHQLVLVSDNGNILTRCTEQALKAAIAKTLESQTVLYQRKEYVAHVDIGSGVQETVQFTVPNVVQVPDLTHIAYFEVNGSVVVLHTKDFMTQDEKKAQVLAELFTSAYSAKELLGASSAVVHIQTVALDLPVWNLYNAKTASEVTELIARMVAQAPSSEV